MEQNNNTLIKVLAIILIAILALNVYRTETNKKELNNLSDELDQIQSQIDSLVALDRPSPFAVDMGNSQIKDFGDRLSSIEAKINALQSTVERTSKATSPTPVKTPSVAGASSNASAATSGDGKQSGRVTASVKVKVENRYVQGTKYLPNVATGPIGEVVVDVTINRLGMVGSASINKLSTITDEDILDQCKEAALKTNFAYNPEAPESSRGTITYTFTAR